MDWMSWSQVSPYNLSSVRSSSSSAWVHFGVTSPSSLSCYDIGTAFILYFNINPLVSLGVVLELQLFAFALYSLR
jgi:hypothetical protein